MKLIFYISFFALVLFAAPFENLMPHAYSHTTDYELEFTLLSTTEYDIYEPGVGIGTGVFVLAKYPYAYIGCSVWGIMVWDISNPYAPILLGHCNSGGSEPLLELGIGDFDIYQDTLLIGTGLNGRLLIVNVADPLHPFLLTSLSYFPGHVHQTLVRGHYAYQAWYAYDGVDSVGFSGLMVYDLSDPTYPIITDSVAIPGLTTWRFWMDENFAYLLDCNWITPNIYIIDIRNPYNLIYHNSFSVGTSVMGG